MGHAARTLDRRALNRALLQRQLLLRRRRLPAMKVVERLVGMHAQVPRDAYIGLRCRIDGFRLETLSDAIEGRRAVRMTLFRGTLHLVTAEDALALRPLVQPIIERTFRSSSPFRTARDSVDVDELLAHLRRVAYGVGRAGRRSQRSNDGSAARLRRRAI